MGSTDKGGLFVSAADPMDDVSRGNVSEGPTQAPVLPQGSSTHIPTHPPPPRHEVTTAGVGAVPGAENPSPIQATTTAATTDDGGGVNLGLAIGIPVAIIFLIFVIILIICICRKWKAKKRGGMDLEHKTERNGNVPMDGIIREKKISHILLRQPSRQGAELYVVRHYYEAEDSNQLTLRTGRFVEVLEKLENGWWRGTIDDTEGWFPAQFVKKIDVTGSLVIEDVDGENGNGPRPKSQRKSQSYEDWLKESAPNGKVENIDQDNIQGYLNEIFTIDDETDDSRKSTPDRKTMGLFESKIVEEKEEIVATDSDFTDQEKRIEFSSEEEPTPSVIRKDSGTNLTTKEGSSEMRDVIAVERTPSVAESHKLEPIQLVRPNGPGTSSSPNDAAAGTGVAVTTSVPTNTTKSQPGEISGQGDASSPLDKPARAGRLSDAGSDTPRSSARDGNQSDIPSEVTHSDLLSSQDDTFDSEIDEDSRSMLAKFIIDKVQGAQTMKVFVAMYPFTPSADDQIALAPNDVIVAEGDVDTNGWIKGKKRNSGESGWFPKSYVREGASPIMAKKLYVENGQNGDIDPEDILTGTEHRAIYPYSPQQEGDLTLDPGDTVVVLEMLENGWWRGCKGDKEGWFPGTYVEAIPQTPATPSAQGYTNGSTSPQASPLAASSPSQSGYNSLALNISPIPTLTREGAATQGAGTPEEGPDSRAEGAQPGEGKGKAKPQLPRRYVVPRLVKLQPKKLARLSKLVKKPSRPAPPAPKSPNGGAKSPGAKFPGAKSPAGGKNGKEKVPSSPGTRVQGSSPARNGGGKAEGGKKRRMSVERPKVPPPRPPTAPPSRRLSEGSSPGGFRPPFLRSASEGYTNVIVSIPDTDIQPEISQRVTSPGPAGISRDSITDSPQGSASSLADAGVEDERLAAQEKSPGKKTPPARPVMPVAPLTQHKGSKTPPPMRLFSSKDEEDIKDTKPIGEDDKRTPPPLPPKPDPQRLRSPGRSKSDPNHLVIKSLALGTQNPRLQKQAERYENVAISDLKPIPEKETEPVVKQEVVKSTLVKQEAIRTEVTKTEVKKPEVVRPEGKVPPQRPKDPPRRSQSSSSLLSHTQEEFPADFTTDVSFAENEINEILLNSWSNINDSGKTEEEIGEDMRETGKPSTEESQGEGPVLYSDLYKQEVETDTVLPADDAVERLTFEDDDDSEVFIMPPQTRPPVLEDSITESGAPGPGFQKNSGTCEDTDSSIGDLPSTFLARPVTPPRSTSPVKRAKVPHHRRPKSSSPVPGSMTGSRDSGNGSLPTSPLTSYTATTTEPTPAVILDTHPGEDSQYYTPVSSMSYTSKLGITLRTSETPEKENPPDMSITSGERTMIHILPESTLDNSPPNDFSNDATTPTNSTSNLAVTSPSSTGSESRHLRFYTPAKFVSKFSPSSGSGANGGRTSPETESREKSRSKRVISPVPTLASDGKVVSRPVKVDLSTPRPYFRSSGTSYSTYSTSGPTDELIAPVRRDYSTYLTSGDDLAKNTSTPQQTTSEPQITIKKTKFSTSPLHDLDDMDLESEV